VHQGRRVTTPPIGSRETDLTSNTLACVRKKRYDNIIYVYVMVWISLFSVVVVSHENVTAYDVRRAFPTRNNVTPRDFAEIRATRTPKTKFRAGLRVYRTREVWNILLFFSPFKLASQLQKNVYLRSYDF